MSMKSISILASVAVVITAGLAAPVDAANAAPSPAAVSPSATVPYNDTDVVGYLAAARGRIAHDHPDLLNYLPAGGDTNEVTDGQVAELTDLLVAADPQFNAHVTARLQSGDPYEVESAVTAYADALEKVSTNHSETVATLGDGKCLVVLVGAVLLALAVAVKVTMYPKTVDGQQATRDLAAAIAAEIR